MPDAASDPNVTENDKQDDRLKDDKVKDQVMVNIIYHGGVSALLPREKLHYPGAQVDPLAQVMPMCPSQDENFSEPDCQEKRIGQPDQKNCHDRPQGKHDRPTRGRKKCDPDQGPNHRRKRELPDR